MLRTCLVGALGVASGVAVEKYRREYSQSSLPTVFAAKTIDPTAAGPPAVVDNIPGKAVATTGDITQWLPPKSGGGRIEQIARHGFPSLDTIRSFDNFVLSYDRRNRTAIGC
ncbi:unnamed protein product [Medioppia subpectinata]|uniref:Uncharacterized protein n=1 Tax=Medioppia subpectinata TaxID=1979941 RepID=A0A7R9KMV9_9ACAR|nr:unnamed protein product [Medioppia subpectinata]CAG2106519.1 unnamed protein product [Medioppia subpectinata]